MKSNRLEAFSDGVLAIIITVMVLELKVPHGKDVAVLRPLVPLSASAGEPEQTLSFHFEQQDRTICSVTGVATWHENQPDQGLAKRASDWMSRMGIGKVYSGLVYLDLRSCEFERGSSIDLVLEEGDEKSNRVTL